MDEYLENAAGFFYAVLFVVSLVFVFVGIRFVYLGTAEALTVELLGFQIPGGILGKTCIGIGALGLMFLVGRVLRSVRDMFT